MGALQPARWEQVQGTVFAVWALPCENTMPTRDGLVKSNNLGSDVMLKRTEAFGYSVSFWFFIRIGYL